LSGTVHHHIADKVEFEFEDLGRQELKNISRPVRIYRMGGDENVVPEDSVAVNPAVAVSDRRAIAVG
jgi:adenylate cyclase